MFQWDLAENGHILCVNVCYVKINLSWFWYQDFVVIIYYIW